MSRGRLEAFSDGVFAIVVTLLVLDLHEPMGDESVFGAIGRQWPQLAVYVAAFLMVGVWWVNHHLLFRGVAHTGRGLTVLNLLLLMFLSLTPWSASIAADGLRRGGDDARQGMFLFTLLCLFASLAFAAIWYVATDPVRPVLHAHLDPAAARARMPQVAVGNLVYASMCGLSFVLPWLVVVAHVGVAAYYLWDRAPEAAITRSSP